MLSTIRPFQHSGLGFLVLAGAIFFSGCGILESDDPTSARLIVGGAAGHPVQLVISTDYDSVIDPETEERSIVLNTSDTTTVSAPFDQRYDMGSRQRFYAKLFSDEIPSTPVGVQIFIDGSLRYDRQTTFDDEFLEFIFSVR